MLQTLLGKNNNTSLKRSRDVVFPTGLGENSGSATTTNINFTSNGTPANYFSLTSVQSMNE